MAITPSLTGATSSDYFASIANKILVQGRLEGEQSWRLAMASKIERTWQYFYNNKSTLEADIRRHPNEHPNDYQAKPKHTLSLVDRAVQQYFSNVYGLPVLRLVPNYPEFESVVKEINQGLDRKNRYRSIQISTEIAGTTAVIPRAREDGSIFYDIYTMEQMFPSLDSLTGDLTGLSLETITDFHDKSVSRIEAWTADGWAVYEDGKLIEQNDNPYGRIPAVIFRAEDGGALWWGISRAMKLVDANREVNEMFTDLASLQRDQTASLLALSGADGEQGEEMLAVVGNNRYVSLPEGVQAQYLTPDVPLENVMKVLQYRIDQALKDGAVIEVSKEGKTPESGFAMSIRIRPEANVMKHKREIYADADAELNEVAVLVQDVAKTGGAKRLAADFHVETHFDTEGLIPKTSDELYKETMAQEIAISLGIKSPVDIIQEQYKLSRQDAERRFNDNQLLNAGVNRDGMSQGAS